MVYDLLIYCWIQFAHIAILAHLFTSKIKPVNPKGNQCWIFIGRTKDEAETPIMWPPYAKSWLIGKDPDAGKDWRQKEKGTLEDEMVKWHHQFNRHEFEQTLGDFEEQGSLACCSPWVHKELDVIEWQQKQQCSLGKLTHNFYDIFGLIYF